MTLLQFWFAGLIALTVVAIVNGDGKSPGPIILAVLGWGISFWGWIASIAIPWIATLF